MARHCAQWKEGKKPKPAPKRKVSMFNKLVKKNLNNGMSFSSASKAASAELKIVKEIQR